MPLTSLICLDDPALSGAVLDRFQTQGWRTTTKVQDAAALQPDLVVLDARALYLLEALKSDPRTSRLSVVVIGGPGDWDLKSRCLKLGALAYLARPLDLGPFDALTRFIEFGLRGPEVDEVDARRLGAVAPLAR